MRTLYSVALLIVATIVGLGCFIANASALTFLKIIGFIVIGWWIIVAIASIAVCVYVSRSFLTAVNSRKR